MKKSNLILMLSFIVSISVYSQEWSINGNSGIANSNFLGTTNSAPLRIKTVLEQSILFSTHNTVRLTINKEGLVGIGNTFSTPSSQLHLKSITSGELFRTDGPDDVINKWRMITGGVERFRLYTSTNNNVFLQTRTAGGIFGFRTGGNNFFPLRMLIKGEAGSNFNDGNIALGNNLPENFKPLDRLHLHHDVDSSITRIRITNASTGSENSDGFAFGIRHNGNMLFTQYEEENVDFITPSNFDVTKSKRRFRIAPNGQVFIGTPNDANDAEENIIDGETVAGFSPSHRTALLNVRGPINSCFPLYDNFHENTILYSKTNPSITTPSTTDGFRMKLSDNFFGLNDGALIFEKTDGTDSIVDGGIAFTNTGKDNIEKVSAYIRGNGRMYVGKNILPSGQLNRFTIDSEAGDATPSGLRFINLTSAASLQDNPGNGVLSVDQNGDVIYVGENGGNGGSGFAACNEVNGGQLQTDSKIDLNENNFYFTHDPASTDLTQNKIGIGYECNAILPIARLSVKQNGNGTEQVGYGIYSAAIDNDRAIGVHAIAAGNINSIAVYGSSVGNSQLIYPSLNNTRFGGYFRTKTTNVPDTANYGIFASSSGDNNSFAGYFQGDVHITDQLFVGSDQKFKEEVKNEENALELIKKLRPVTYKMKKSDYPQFSFSGNLQHGFIAQEVERVLPELVHNSYHPGESDSLGNEIYAPIKYKSVNYIALTSVNTQAIKELHKKIHTKDSIIDDLTARLTRLENSLSVLLPTLREMNEDLTIQQNNPEKQQEIKDNLKIVLSDQNTVILSQNAPNPFAESTVIEYSIPETVQRAQMLFHNNLGILINSIDILERGKGQLTVYATDLSSGIYTYSLITDNKVVITKQMVKR